MLRSLLARLTGKRGDVPAPAELAATLSADAGPEAAEPREHAAALALEEPAPPPTPSDPEAGPPDTLVVAPVPDAAGGVALSGSTVDTNILDAATALQSTDIGDPPAEPPAHVGLAAASADTDNSTEPPIGEHAQSAGAEPVRQTSNAASVDAQALATLPPTTLPGDAVAPVADATAEAPGSLPDDVVHPTEADSSTEAERLTAAPVVEIASAENAATLASAGVPEPSPASARGQVHSDAPGPAAELQPPALAEPEPEAAPLAALARVETELQRERTQRRQLESLLRAEQDEANRLRSELSETWERWQAEQAERERAELTQKSEHEQHLEHVAELVSHELTESGLLADRDALLAQVQAQTAELEQVRARLADAERRAAHAEEGLQVLSDLDPLTDLPARRVLADRMAMVVFHADRYRHKAALLSLGVAGFEAAPPGAQNDVTRSVSALLQRTLRLSDTITRLEFDEFAVLLPELPDDEHLARVTEKLLDAFRTPLGIGDVEVRVTLSIGIALYPDDGLEFEELLLAARTTMQRARRQGGDGYAIHAPAAAAIVANHLATERALRKAFADGDLLLHYQPIRECRSGRVVCVEGLLRWRAAAGHSVPVPDFIAVADAAGLSVPLGHWTLRAACLQARIWQETGHPELRVSVNITARLLAHPSLEGLLRRALGESGLHAKDLVIELSESEVMHDLERGVARLRELRQLGVGVALDGFGVGRSSLAQLSQLPLDALKLDRSLIAGIGRGPREAAVASAAIALGRILGLTVVAVGVETPDQVALLTRAECHQMQGNLCGAPLPGAECAPLLGSLG